MRKKGTRRRGRVAEGGRGRSIVAQYLSNDITVCSSYFGEQNYDFFFLLLLLLLLLYE